MLTTFASGIDVVGEGTDAKQMGLDTFKQVSL